MLPLAGRLSTSVEGGGAGRLLLDMGMQGVGGNRNGTAGNGYYRLSLDLDGDTVFETQRTFFRLLGDLTGDRSVTNADRALLATLGGPYDPNRDVNGDGVVDSRDRLLIKTGVSLPFLATDD